jgi:hypothetical protein
MEMSNLPIGPEAESLLQQHGGPLILPGQKGEYIVMRADVYDAMLGIESDDKAETIASVRRGLADMEAGRMRDLDDVFGDLDAER